MPKGNIAFKFVAMAVPCRGKSSGLVRLFGASSLSSAHQTRCACEEAKLCSVAMLLRGSFSYLIKSSSWNPRHKELERKNKPFEMAHFSRSFI